MRLMSLFALESPIVLGGAATYNKRDNRNKQVPSHLRCYNCGEKGHFAVDCPEPRREKPEEGKYDNEPKNTKRTVRAKQQHARQAFRSQEPQAQVCAHRCPDNQSAVAQCHVGVPPELPACPPPQKDRY